jgi:hypothetical protein
MKHTNIPPLDYEKVAAAADELESAGLNATVRSVRSVIGYGSTTTIGQFLNQRKSALRGEIGIDDSIDDIVINAIRNNIGNRAKKVMDAANTMLAKLRRENYALLEENARLREELAVLLGKPVTPAPDAEIRIAALQEERRKLLLAAKKQPGKNNERLEVIRAELQALYANLRAAAVPPGRRRSD